MFAKSSRVRWTCLLALLCSGCGSDAPSVPFVVTTGGPGGSVGSPEDVSSPSDPGNLPDPGAVSPDPGHVAPDPGLVSSPDPGGPTPDGTSDGDVAPPHLDAGQDAGPIELCFGPQDCEDDDPCTKNVCVAQTNTCQFEPIPECCHDDSECAPPTPCISVECVRNECVLEPIFPCCQSDAQCDDGAECTDDACVPLEGGGAECVNAPVPGCCGIAAQYGFEAASVLSSWDVESDSPEVTWQIHDHRFLSPPSALYMGNPEDLDYVHHNEINPAQHLPVEATIEAPPLVLSGASVATLRIGVHMDIQGCDGTAANVDLFRIFADTEVASGLVLWGKCDANVFGNWTQVEIDLSPFVEAQPTLRFSFESVDDLDNGGQGIVLDDLEVEICY